MPRREPFFESSRLAKIREKAGVITPEFIYFDLLKERSMQAQRDLFPDAESRENHPQQVLGIHPSRNLTKGIHRFTQIERHELWRGTSG